MQGLGTSIVNITDARDSNTGQFTLNWELGYLCSDHHVRQIGASITDFSYERAAGASSGTLYYTLSMLLCDDSGNLDYGRAVVDILHERSRHEPVTRRIHYSASTLRAVITISTIEEAANATNRRGTKFTVHWINECAMRNAT